MTEVEIRKKERYEKAKATILAKDPDFYKKIGSKGAKNGDNRPFRDKSIAKRAAGISAEVRKRNSKKTIA